MQKLWLKDFEFNINPATAQAGQQLVQAGTVRALREVEKHFWVALVDDPDDAPREVEVIITPHKIKAFTCECWPAGRRLMCPHIAATLLKLRQFLEQKAEERRARAEAQATADTGRLTVQNVLNDVTPDALLDFVRDYARRDRDFALALKTQFAGSLEGPVNPFLLVLDAAIPRSLVAGSGARETDFRRLRKTLDELDTQMKSALAEHNYRTVFQIATALLEKIGPFLAKNNEQKRVLLAHFCQEALQLLIRLNEEALSPELRAGIWDAAFSLAERQIAAPELGRELILFLTATVATDETRFKRIETLFQHTPAPAPPLVLHLFLAALAQRGLPAAAARVLDDYAERPAVVKAAVLELYYLKHWEAAAHAATYFLAKNIFHAGERRELEDVLLIIAEKTGDKPGIYRLLRERFLQNGQFDFYNRLKTSAGDDWPAEREQLLAELAQRADFRKLAAVFAAENDLGALSELLSKSDDLAFLQRYEDQFLTADKTFIQERYVAVLSGHLSGHFGRPASAYVRDALQHLLQKNESALVIGIIRALTAAFPERHTLPEELAELFPKTRRKSILQA